MDWHTVVADLQCDRSLDRERAVNSLLEMLASNEQLQLLAQFGPLCTFQQIFHAVNVCIELEATNLEEEESRPGADIEQMRNRKQILCTMVERFVEKADRSMCILDVNALIQSLSGVFMNNYKRLNFGGSYYLSVVSLIVNHRSYWRIIKYSHWKRLILVSIVAYNDQISELSKSNIGRIISFLLSVGTRNSHLSIWIPSKMDFFKTCIMEMRDEQSIMEKEAVMMMILTFSKAIAVENRKSLCQFGEEVMEAVNNLFDHSVAEVDFTKQMIIDFYELQMKAHHPLNAGVTSLASYAYDWNRWNKLLSVMYVEIYEEMLCMPLRSQCPSEDEIDRKYLDFAVEIIYQVTLLMETGSYLDYDDEQPVPKKRQKMVLGFKGVLEMIKDHGTKETAWPWLSLLEEIIKKHQDLITLDNYLEIAHQVLELLEECQGKLVMKHILRCCTSLAMVKMPKNIRDDASELWDKIWNIALRSVGLSHCEEAVHGTIRAVLNMSSSEKKVKELIQLYMNDSFSASMHNLRTLKWVICRFPIMESMSCSTKLDLVKWSYEIRPRISGPPKRLPVELLAPLLIQICSKGNKCTEIVSEILPTRTLESYYSKLVFTLPLSMELYPEIIEPVKIKLVELVLDDDVVMFVKDLICLNSESTVEWLNDVNKLDNIPMDCIEAAEYAVSRLKLLVLAYLNIISWKGTNITTICMSDFLQQYSRVFKALADVLLKILRHRKDLLHKLSLTVRELSGLYEMPLTDDLKSFVIENTPSTFIEFCKLAVEKEPEEFDELICNRRISCIFTNLNVEPYITGSNELFSVFNITYDKNVITKDDVMKVQISEMLGSFSCLNANSEAFLNQKQVITHYLTILPLEYKQNFPLIFQMVGGFLSAPIRRGALDPQYVDVIINLYADFVDNNHGDIEVFNVMLSTFEGLLKGIANSPTLEIVIPRLEYFVKKIEGYTKGNVPPSTLKRLARIVGFIAKYDYSWTSDWLQSSGEPLEISTYFLQLLDSEFAEVRLNVAENLHPIFRQLFHARLDCRPTLTAWINYILASCFGEDSTSPERKENQVLCGLHGLTIVAITTAYFRKLAIYNILKLLIVFDIRQSIGSTILSVICRYLNICNTRIMLERYMQYIIERWLVHGELEKFPYWLLCNSLNEFYYEYKNIIFSVMWMLNHKDIDKFCSTIETSVKQMLMENSAQVLAFTLQRTVNLQDSELSGDMRRISLHVVDQVKRLSPGLTLYQIISCKENSFLYECMSLFYDDSTLNDVCSNIVIEEKEFKVCIPEPNPFHYCSAALQESLDYLAVIVEVDQCLLKYCISKAPDHIRDVMYKLATDAVNAPSQPDCIVSIISFNELVERIAKELQNADVSYLSMICTGFFRDVCFTFIRIMRRKWCNEDDVASCTAFFLLHQFTSRYCTQLQNAVQIFSVPLIGALVDLVEDGVAKNYERHVLKMIEDLIKMDFLRGPMHNLCPFPSSKTYESIRKIFKELVASEMGTSLRRSFTQFLENYHTYGYCRKESLLHLQNELKLNKEELIIFYEELKTKKKAFSLYKNCILHRVMCLLTKLCTSSEPKQATEAAKCLAEIGNADLETLVLTHQKFDENDPVPSDVMEENPLHKLILKCMEMVPRYMIDYNLEVVKTASNVLKDIINTAEGVLTLRTLSLRKPHQMNMVEDFLFYNPVLSSEEDPPFLIFLEENFSTTTDLWIPCETTSHAEWLTNLTKGLLKCIGGCSFIGSLEKLCSLKLSLCEEIFPLTMEVLLRCGGSISREALFGRVQDFFKASYRTFVCEMRGQEVDTNAPQLRNKKIILTLLNAINLLSLQHPGKHEEYRNICEGQIAPKPINYLHCAVSAQNCSAFLSAIQYSALWLNENARGSQPVTLTLHRDLETEGIHQIIHVLNKAYSGIGDVDSLSACGKYPVLEPKGRIEYFQGRGKWEQVMRSYELEVSNCGPQRNVDGLMYSLLHIGMEELLMGTLDYREDEQFQKFKYECAWRLGCWDLLSNYNERRQPSSGLCFLDSTNYMPDNISYRDVDFIFHRNLFLSLRCIKNNKFSESLELVETSRHFVIDSMSSASLEVSNNLCETITRLQTLKDVQDFATSILNVGVTGRNDVIQSWKRSDAIGHKNFRALESLKAVRLTLLKHCCDDVERDHGGLLVIDQPPVREALEIMLEIGGLAREKELFSVSEKYLRAVREVENVCNDAYFMPLLILEEAKLFSSKGNKHIAFSLLHNLMENIDDLNCSDENCLIYSQALTTLGHLTIETHAEKSKSALLRYFDRAAELITEFEVKKSTGEFLDATAALATYADELYVLLSKYVESSEFEKKKKAALDSMNIVAEGHNIPRPTQDEQHSMFMLEKQAEIDEIELSEVKADRLSYYMLAYKNYVKYLQYCDNVRPEMLFRFLCLLLEELDNEDDEIISYISSIPSYKFLPAIPQLIPRMTQSKGRWITSVIERCAMEHPHHVVPYIMMQAYSLSDLESEEGFETFITKTQKANSIAAKNLIGQIKSNPEMSEYICQLEKLWQVLINVAMAPFGHRNQRDIEVTLPPSHPLNSLNNLDLVQVPTVELHISPSKNYNIVSVWKYCPEFSLVGGINVPKKITCIGSNGLKYHQLLKGKDDMRQDAVMQQVFQLMNNLLMREEEAKNLDLRMRTYKVVPLSLRSGIIEWVDNTISLGSYLKGYRNIGAHVRLNPHDYCPDLCRTMMMRVVSSSKVVRQQVFIDIIDHIKPVFRHYFLEKFPNPALWYEMRQAYTRSVATSSMIGYVLGLGDRHLSNILIDVLTSEVIHIDLGIAFEQGKTLKYPETVPFRLTRDIIDGMGEIGVEGVFRRSCEVTMTLMRKYKSAITSVLQVLMYDPLFSWTFKPKQHSPPGEDDHLLPELALPVDILEPGPSEPRSPNANWDTKSSQKSSPASRNEPVSTFTQLEKTEDILEPGPSKPRSPNVTWDIKSSQKSSPALRNEPVSTFTQLEKTEDILEPGPSKPRSPNVTWDIKSSQKSSPALRNEPVSTFTQLEKTEDILEPGPSKPRSPNVTWDIKSSQKSSPALRNEPVSTFTQLEKTEDILEPGPSKPRSPNVTWDIKSSQKSSPALRNEPVSTFTQLEKTEDILEPGPSKPRSPNVTWDIKSSQKSSPALRNEPVSTFTQLEKTEDILEPGPSKPRSPNVTWDIKSSQKSSPALRNEPVSTFTQLEKTEDILEPGPSKPRSPNVTWDIKSSQKSSPALRNEPVSTFTQLEKTEDILEPGPSKPRSPNVTWDIKSSQKSSPALRNEPVSTFTQLEKTEDILEPGPSKPRSPNVTWDIKSSQKSSPALRNEPVSTFTQLEKTEDILEPGPSKPRSPNVTWDIKSSQKSSPALRNEPVSTFAQLEKTDEERNAVAERAILRLEQKLMGLDSGDQAPLSVEAQVQRLIKDAQDIENLCMLYPGWQPYL